MPRLRYLSKIALNNTSLSTPSESLSRAAYVGIIATVLTPFRFAPNTACEIGKIRLCSRIRVRLKNYHDFSKISRAFYHLGNFARMMCKVEVHLRFSDIGGTLETPFHALITFKRMHAVFKVHSACNACGNCERCVFIVVFPLVFQFELDDFLPSDTIAPSALKKHCILFSLPFSTHTQNEFLLFCFFVLSMSSRLFSQTIFTLLFCKNFEKVALTLFKSS